MKRNISGSKGTARKKTRGNNSLPVETIKKISHEETNCFELNSKQLTKEPVISEEINFSQHFEEINEWVTNVTKTIFGYKFKFVPKCYKKLAAFDLDGTIITTKSKKKFAQDIDDWKILSPKIKTKLENLTKKGFLFLIFSNQLGVKYNRVTIPMIKQKFMNIVHHLNIPCVAFLCTDLDKNRKPSNGMLDFFQNEMNNNTQLDLNESFFVGDAMGRPQDHSAADILFAVNSKIKFIPIESFLNDFEKPKLYNHDNMTKLKIPKFNPFKFVTDDLEFKIKLKNSEIEFSQINSFISELNDYKNVIIFFCGLHGSGKSFFYEKYLKSSFSMINKSKTDEQLNIDSFESFFKNNSNKKLVLDQPNCTLSTRKLWLNLAKKHNLKPICIYFDVNEYLCLHNIRFRNFFCDSKEPIFKPWEIFKQKTSLILPEYSEGFEKIFTTKFYMNFDNDYLKSKYMMYLYEKE